jgi:hypothetical protein
MAYQVKSAQLPQIEGITSDVPQLYGAKPKRERSPKPQNITGKIFAAIQADESFFSGDYKE